jgi:hypothetical protein
MKQIVGSSALIRVERGRPSMMASSAERRARRDRRQAASRPRSRADVGADLSGSDEVEAVGGRALLEQHRPCVEDLGPRA